MAIFSKLAAVIAMAVKYSAYRSRCNHLGGNRGGFQAQPGAGLLFDRRRHISETPHRTGYFPIGDGFPGPFQPGTVPLHFRIEYRQLDAESDRFGMDAVGTADHHRLFMFQRPALERIEQLIHVFDDNIRGP